MKKEKKQNEKPKTNKIYVLGVCVHREFGIAISSTPNGTGVDTASIVTKIYRSIFAFSTIIRRVKFVRFM